MPDAARELHGPARRRVHDRAPAHGLGEDPEEEPPEGTATEVTDEARRTLRRRNDPPHGEPGLPGPGLSESSADAMMTPPPVTPEEGTKMGRNVTVLASAQLITWTMTLAWTLVVPRALGPSGLGTIMAAWSITGILGVVLGLGTRNYLVRESVVRPESAPGLIGTALVLRIVLSPLLIAAA